LKKLKRPKDKRERGGGTQPSGKGSKKVEWETPGKYMDHVKVVKGDPSMVTIIATWDEGLKRKPNKDGEKREREDLQGRKTLAEKGCCI